MAKIFSPKLPAPNLYRSVARNESLFIDMIDMGFIKPTGLMDRKVIPPRVREILILRTCVKTKNEYEFNLHIGTISEKMGLTLDEIEDIKCEQLNEGLWSDADRNLMQMADELIGNLSLSDETFEKLITHFSEENLIEMVLLIGLYTTVAMMVSFIRPEMDFSLKKVPT
ncbi:MAG: hypothetical protein IPG24_27575 [Leptospiraceae bacterium]|nr:hypothetical protein [Leptospiraceae bacterium]